MAQESVAIAGTDQDKETFKACLWHYQIARQDNIVRRKFFDTADVLFRSYIDESMWPYRSVVFDPRIVTTIFEKTARILANKPEGRLLPREGGDALGAKVNSELLSFQWDDNERSDSMPMLAKWNLMDMNARKYGASFGLCKWKWKRQIMRTGGFNQKEQGKSIVFFDGPNFQPLNNRDCLPNPAYSSINNWFQYRTYPTIQELEDENDAARGKPIYMNLDILKEAINSENISGGDTRTVNYVKKQLAIRGLQDLLGRDPVYKTVELVTEYRNDRWITFSPKHGVVLRDIPNPYDHQQIPVVMLKYYPVDEDIYGLSEIEPVERLQKAINALINQYLDAINMSLYTPLKVRNTGGAVQMHTLEFGPGKKWLMNDPATDVITHEQDLAGISEFTSTYRFLVGAFEEGMGETSAAVSNLIPGQGDKTATEVKDLATSRSARDNFNQLFLGEAINKQMMFWYKMNQQFLFNSSDHKKVIRIVGKDAIRFFQGVGLDAQGLDEDSINTLSQEHEINNQLVQQHMQNNPYWNGDPSAVAGFHQTEPSALSKPLFPVSVNGKERMKFQMDEGGQYGTLVIEKDDLSGEYDYIADIGSMSTVGTDQEIQSRKEAIDMLTGVDPKTGQPIGVAAMLQQEGIKVRVQDLVEDYLEDIGMRDADKYFEKIQQLPGEGGSNGQAQVNPNANGAGNAQTGQPAMGNGANPGMANGVQALPNGAAQPIVS